MKLVVPMEVSSGEHRVGLTPDSIPSLKKMGFDVFVESNAGSASSFTDIDYKKRQLQLYYLMRTKYYDYI